MKLDHVTYQVPAGFLSDASLTIFFKMLEMQEIVPDEEVEKGWNVRWFEEMDGFQIHLVEPIPPSSKGPIDLQLGHFCAVLTRDGYKAALKSTFCIRNSEDSPRAWLRHAGTGLRVEIRPKKLSLDEAEAMDKLDIGDEFRSDPRKRMRGEVSLKIGGIDLTSPGVKVEIDQKAFEPIDWSSVTQIPPTDELMERVFDEALRIFRERNEEHRDSWRQEGWRGCVSNVRRKAVRAWDNLWHSEEDKAPNVDDLYDVINYCAFTVLSAWEQNRDGDWNY